MSSPLSPLSSSTRVLPSPQVTTYHTMIDHLHDYMKRMLDLKDPLICPLMLQWSNQKIKAYVKTHNINIELSNYPSQSAMVLFICEQFSQAFAAIGSHVLGNNINSLEAWEIRGFVCRKKFSEADLLAQYPEIDAAHPAVKQFFLREAGCAHNPPNLREGDPLHLRIHFAWINAAYFSESDENLCTIRFEEVHNWSDFSKLVRFFYMRGDKATANTWCTRLLAENNAFIIDILTLQLLIHLEKGFDITTQIRLLDLVEETKSNGLGLILKEFHIHSPTMQKIIKLALLRSSREYLRFEEIVYWASLRDSIAKEGVDLEIFCVQRILNIKVELGLSPDETLADLARLYARKGDRVTALEFLKQAKSIPVTYKSTAYCCSAWKHLKNTKNMLAELDILCEISEEEGKNKTIERTYFILDLLEHIPLSRRNDYLDITIENLEAFIAANPHSTNAPRMLCAANYYRGVKDSSTLPSSELDASGITFKDPKYPAQVKFHKALDALKIEPQLPALIVYAKLELTAAYKIDPHYYTGMLLAQLEFKEGNYESAYLLYKKIEVEIKELAEEAHMMRYGESMLKTNRFQEVVEWHERFSLPTPFMILVALAHHHLGNILLAKNFVQLHKPKTERQKELIGILYQRAPRVVVPMEPQIKQDASSKPKTPQGAHVTATSQKTEEVQKKIQERHLKKTIPTLSKASPKTFYASPIAPIPVAQVAVPAIAEVAEQHNSVTLGFVGSFKGGVIPLNSIPREMVKPLSEIDRARLISAKTELATLSELMKANLISAATAAAPSSALTMDVEHQKSYALYLTFRICELLTQVGATKEVFNGLRQFIRHHAYSVDMEFLKKIFEEFQATELERELDLLLISKAPKIEISSRFKFKKTSIEALVQELKNEVNLYDFKRPSSLERASYLHDVAKGSCFYVGCLLSALRDREVIFDNLTEVKKLITMANNIAHLPGDFAVLAAGAAPVIISTAELDQFIGNARKNLAQFFEQ